MRGTWAATSRAVGDALSSSSGRVGGVTTVRDLCRTPVPRLDGDSPNPPGAVQLLLNYRPETREVHRAKCEGGTWVAILMPFVQLRFLPMSFRLSFGPSFWASDLPQITTPPTLTHF